MNIQTLKQRTVALAGSTTVSLAMFLATPVPVAAGGTDILHFTVTSFATNNGVEPGADGVVMASQKTQGHADNQKLTIALAGLATNTPYELIAAIDSDTNATDIGPFTTDAKGNAIFSFASLGNGHGGGKHSSPLPDGLNPVSLIRSVDIVNSNAAAVLTADLSAPDKLQYLVKRSLTSGGVKATLMIHATTRQTQFRLLSTGLATNTDYVLAINGEAVQTNSSDAKGRLMIKTLTTTPPFVLDVRSVELLDTSSNVVLQTDLP